MVGVRQPPQRPQDPIVVEQHPAGPLDAGLHQDGGDPGAVLREIGVERCGRRRIHGQGDHMLRRHDVGEQAVHPLLRVAHGHRAQRVAVIAAQERQEPAAPRLAAVDPVLQRHLHGDLHRDRAGLGEEDVVEVAGQQVRQPPRQAIGRLVREAAEHHVCDLADLRLQGRPDVRVAIAVAGGPPRGDAVNQGAAVLQDQATALRRSHRQGRRRGLHLAIGSPDMRRALNKPVGRLGVGGCGKG